MTKAENFQRELNIALGAYAEVEFYTNKGERLSPYTTLVPRVKVHGHTVDIDVITGAGHRDYDFMVIFSFCVRRRGSFVKRRYQKTFGKKLDAKNVAAQIVELGREYAVHRKHIEESNKRIVAEENARQGRLGDLCEKYGVPNGMLGTGFAGWDHEIKLKFNDAQMEAVLKALGESNILEALQD